MKVKHLIEELERMDGEAEVHFSYDYGDHVRTIVAPKVSAVEEARVVHSDYHSMPKLVDEDDTRFKDAKEIVLLS